LADLSYTVNGGGPLGDVLVMSLPSLVIEGKPCTLGAFYLLKKDAIATSATHWSAETLQAATQKNGEVPPQAKDFGNEYFVFEPSQAACTQGDDSKSLEKEGDKRWKLWKSVQTAERIEQ
jgi:hypothetical protein